MTSVDDCNRWCYLQGSTVPVRAARHMRFRALTSGDEYSCAIALDDSRAHCWGLDRLSWYETVGRLAGNIRGTTDIKYCPVDGGSSVYAPIPCSHAPLAVDTRLDRRLVFRTIKAVGRVTCGTTGAAGEPEEMWCWGDTTSVPTKRDAMPAGF